MHVVSTLASLVELLGLDRAEFKFINDGALTETSIWLPHLTLLGDIATLHSSSLAL